MERATSVYMKVLAEALEMVRKQQDNESYFEKSRIYTDMLP